MYTLNINLTQVINNYIRTREEKVKRVSGEVKEELNPGRMGNQEILSKAEKSRNQNTNMLFWMTVFRTCYPQIWCLGILSILNWRNVRNSRCSKDFLTFPSLLKQGLRSSSKRYPSYTWRKETSLSVKMEGYRQKAKGNGFAKFLQFNTLSLYSLIRSHFYDIPLFHQM